jgi:4-hydroxy-2-oxoheptanedioate aldolase
MIDRYEQIRIFKTRLNEDYVLGVFSKTSDPAFVEVMGCSGMDFVIIDLEHGPNSVQTAQNLIRAAEISGILPIVRVKEHSHSVVGEVLDIGAGGIQVPQINDAEAARKAVELSKFAPAGARGVCRFVRAAAYSSMDRFEYFRKANEGVLIVQLEGMTGIGNIDEIINTEGIDIIFIGPYDLSQSLNVTGEIDHPLVVQKMEEITDKCSQKGVAVGTFVDTLENAVLWRKRGVRYLSYSVDVGLFHDKCSEIVQAVRENIPGV